jgi:hypothetical protein
MANGKPKKQIDDDRVVKFLEQSGPDDAADIEGLWSDSSLGDGITDVNYLSVPVGKPKDFFRTHPDKEYRRRTEIYVHKPEGVIDAQHYVIAPEMQGRISEARPCTLVCVVDRDCGRSCIPAIASGITKLGARRGSPPKTASRSG